MSGLGAPIFTDTPRPARPNGVLVPATTLPFLMRSSTPSGPPVNRSAGALDSSFWLSEGPVSKLTVTLCPLACSNPAASVRTPDSEPMPVRTMSSAACAVTSPHAPVTARTPATVRYCHTLTSVLPYIVPANGLAGALLLFSIACLSLCDFEAAGHMVHGRRAG